MIYTDGIHLISGNKCMNELHGFARIIGLNKYWFHKGAKHPHYDLMKGKKNREYMLFKALQYGAIQKSTKELINILNGK
jgi:hypothetical protein